MLPPAALIPYAWSITLQARDRIALGRFPEPRWAGLFKRLLCEHADDGRPALWWFSWPRLAQAEVQAGDQLVFTLYALPAAVGTLNRLIVALRQLPASAPTLPGHPALGSNLVFVAAEPLGAAPSLHCEIETEATLLREHQSLRLCLRSPTRVLHAEHRKRDHEARYVHHQRELDSALLAERLRGTWVDLRSELRIDRIDPPLLDGELVAAELFWTQLAYRNADGQEKPSGGLLGEVILRWPQGMSAEVAHWLACAQHLGVGQRRGFGQGQFAFETLDGQSLKRETVPALSAGRPAHPARSP